jgi:hypothetical protein
VGAHHAFAKNFAIPKITTMLIMRIAVCQVNVSKGIGQARLEINACLCQVVFSLTTAQRAFFQVD